MYQMIRQMIAGKELFGLTPHLTFGDLVSAEGMQAGEHLLECITQSAHNVLKAHMASGLVQELRQV